MSRYALLSDAQWSLIEQMLQSRTGKRGRPFSDAGQVVEGIIYRCRANRRTPRHDDSQPLGQVSPVVAGAPTGVPVEQYFAVVRVIRWRTRDRFSGSGGRTVRDAGRHERCCWG